jgi:hypothetical protein
LLSLSQSCAISAASGSSAPDEYPAGSRIEWNHFENAFRERRTGELEPWVDIRTRAAMVWWLAAVPRARLEAAGTDPERVLAQLSIPPAPTRTTRRCFLESGGALTR